MTLDFILSLSSGALERFQHRGSKQLTQAVTLLYLWPQEELLGSGDQPQALHLVRPIPLVSVLQLLPSTLLGFPLGLSSPSESFIAPETSVAAVRQGEHPCVFLMPFSSADDHFHPCQTEP